MTAATKHISITIGLLLIAISASAFYVIRKKKNATAINTGVNDENALSGLSNSSPSFLADKPAIKINGKFYIGDSDAMYFMDGNGNSYDWDSDTLVLSGKTYTNVHDTTDDIYFGHFGNDGKTFIAVNVQQTQ